jgi:hypothetical protein
MEEYYFEGGAGTLTTRHLSKMTAASSHITTTQAVFACVPDLLPPIIPSAPHGRPALTLTPPACWPLFQEPVDPSTLESTCGLHARQQQPNIDR